MPVIERLAQFFQCAICAGEWPVKGDAANRPKLCRFCRRPDWFAGQGQIKNKRATIVRTVGKKRRVVQQSGQSVLAQIKRIESEQRR